VLETSDIEGFSIGDFGFWIWDFLKGYKSYLKGTKIAMG
jgi:hypothetical protein